MATTSFTALMDQLFQEPSLTAAEVENRLGYKFTAATISATSLTTTDPQIVKGGVDYITERFRNLHLYLAENAEERLITTYTVSGSTATINFIGGNATTEAGATTAYLLRHPWSELRAAANDGLEYIPVEVTIPLAHGPDDYHMQDNNTTSWTGSNGTVAKQTTASQVLWGQRSTSLTLTAADGYMTSTTTRIGYSEEAIIFAILKDDSGNGAIVRAVDADGNTIDSATDVTVTQEQWVLTRKVHTVASDDRGIAVRILGTDNLDQIDVQAAWIVKRTERQFPLPSWLDERFKLKAVERLTLRQAAQEGDTYLIADVQPVGLRERDDWRYVNRPADANPLWLEMMNDCFRHDPIYLTIECPGSAPYGISSLFTTDAATSIVPQHILTAYLKKWIGGLYPSLFPQALALGEREFNERLRARHTDQADYQHWTGPVRTRF